jgi:hypothetical protein
MGAEPGNAVLIRALIAGPLLAVAATGYDLLVSWLKEHGYLDGYTSLAVAAGVAGVWLAGLWVIWPLGGAARVALAVCGGLFVPAGAPMMLGSIRRHVAARGREVAAAQAQAREALR